MQIKRYKRMITSIKSEVTIRGDVVISTRSKTMRLIYFFSYFRGGWDLGQNMCVATGSVFQSFNLGSFRTRASVFKLLEHF